MTAGLLRSPAGERHLHGCGFNAVRFGSFAGVSVLYTSVSFIAVPVYLIMQLCFSYICVCVYVCVDKSIASLKFCFFTSSLFLSLGSLSSSALTSGLGRCSSDLDEQRRTLVSNNPWSRKTQFTPCVALSALEDPQGPCWEGGGERRLHWPWPRQLIGSPVIWS